MLKHLLHNTRRVSLCFLFLTCWRQSVYPQIGGSSHEPASPADERIPPAIARELEALKKRIEQLEAELENRKRKVHRLKR